ncbi:siderophore ABC transporter substrate-binding protein [Lederbergia galactosidilytica]|uniref:ABC transporter n=1 Tax=Lederbergia galactosidilytica TaxID=217031 RepID=A0A0Q9XWW8_9BACI|nr:siderophore ABC transporter substrate-binding protein [Lederbergia galactosidilytica]KRG11657.1 ABC transporter [Lederbergia galactosidilytica]KRG14399.1 ABC transporter [Virgibacillus soli]MBP1916727.1 iron complex transport system substrate-binding protein [Lederbergia galactosidilytica]OAK70976.1 ABC transporter [Lederbergia galactosidilytica]
MKKLSFIFAILFVTAVLAACGSDTKDNEQANEGNGNDNEQQEETLTIKHQLDETEVQKNPEKVVVFDFGALDTLDALGVEGVVGLPKMNVPNYLSKYEGDEYENVGSLKEPDFEKINSLKPDLILISGRQSDLYEDFKEIAPTIYVGLDTSKYMESFKENVNTLAEIFGKEDVAKTELEKIDEKIAALHEKASNDDGKSLVILANEGKMSAYGPSSRFGIIHDVFGFAPVDEGIEASTHGQNVSFEYVLEQNPDYLFVIDRGTAIGGESSSKQLVENELIQKTDAFKNDKIVYLDPENWYLSGGGLESVSAMADEVEVVLE